VRWLELHIDEQNAFQDIQHEFTAVYPFLKMDFFRSFSAAGKPAYKRERIYPWELIRRFVRKANDGRIDIDKSKTVSQVVKSLESMLDLSVMILRRSGNVWIETSLTSDWTLEQQNREGEHISRLS
jgi:hypothetical protein